MASTSSTPAGTRTSPFSNATSPLPPPWFTIANGSTCFCPLSATESSQRGPSWDSVSAARRKARIIGLLPLLALPYPVRSCHQWAYWRQLPPCSLHPVPSHFVH